MSMSRSHIPSLPADSTVPMPPVAHARVAIGDVVRHRMFDFRGVIFDVDPIFANSEEWYEAIPEGIRPAKDQPFYRLLAENMETNNNTKNNQQNQKPDNNDEPID